MFNFLRTFTIRLFIFRRMARVNIVEVCIMTNIIDTNNIFRDRLFSTDMILRMFDVYSTWSLRNSGMYRHVEIAARVYII